MSNVCTLYSTTVTVYSNCFCLICVPRPQTATVLCVYLHLCSEYRKCPCQMFCTTVYCGHCTVQHTLHNCSCLVWVPVNSNCSCLVSSEYLGLGCPLISLRSETKRNGSKNKLNEIAKQCSDLLVSLLSETENLYAKRNERKRKKKQNMSLNKMFKPTKISLSDWTAEIEELRLNGWYWSARMEQLNWTAGIEQLDWTA